MTGNANIRRAMMALTLLTAYLLSTVGTAVLAIGCDCPHSFYRDHSHPSTELRCAGHCCHAHGHDRHSYRATDEIALLTAVGSECCHHNHSTEIELYTADSDDSSTLRMTAAWIEAVLCDSDCRPVVLTECGPVCSERRCPPVQKCRAACRPLRAPPVCA